MNINIYNDSSLIIENVEKLNKKHTISSLNKIKTQPQKQHQSFSDFTTYSCLQMLASTCSNKKNNKSNVDMYKIGLEFLSHKKEKQQELQQQIEQQLKQQCSFHPQISEKSKLFASRNSIKSYKNKELNLIDSQSRKLISELEECTFNPKIIRSKSDIFDRTSPLYDRQIEWKHKINNKNKDQGYKGQLVNMQIINQPKYLDLRASHALKKNIANKYLRSSVTNKTLEI